MSSRKGAGKPFIAGTSGPSPKGKSVSQISSPVADQLSHGVEGISLDSAQDGAWEVYAKKKNRGGRNSGSKAWGNPDLNEKPSMRSSGSVKGPTSGWPSPNVDSRRSDGWGNSRPHSSLNRGLENYISPPSLTPPPPPLMHGWARAASTQPLQHGSTKNEISSSPQHVDAHDDNVDEYDVDHDDSDEVDDDFDDELLSDEFDSDSSQKSHETRKKNKWFTAFFDILDKLTVEEINEPARQWHCPACQGGPGAIDWYRGLNPLMAHAKTKRSQRATLHRELAELLDEELRRRGTSVVPAGESFGKWKGLNGDGKDHEIVWPPMVVILNTILDKDDNDKWTGMGNQELLDYFSSYRATKARHAYGPQGHRGMSLLIFENSAMGYLEAENLDKLFREQGKDREAWDHHRVLFYPGGKRQLYGYLAEKGDLDIFNKHSQVKARLKFEMRSHQEMVVSQMKQMSEDNQQLLWFKNRVAKEQRHSKVLEESLGVVSEKYRKTLEENRIVRLRTKLHHDQSKEEMDYQEKFFKDQLKSIHETMDANEESFELIQQEERQKVKQSNANPSSIGDSSSSRVNEVEKFISHQEKEMGEYLTEREKVIKNHEDEKIAMKRRHGEEEVALETKFKAELSQLMAKYTPHSSE